MSSNDVLSKDEVGALLTGVADGTVDTNSGLKASGEVSPFEFKSSYKVSSEVPASLVNIYNKVAVKLQNSLYQMLRREVAVAFSAIRRYRYDEYLASLEKPLCVHSITEKSLPGTALIVFDAALVYSFVDNYFGGLGEPGQTANENDLSPAEISLSAKLLQIILATLTECWSTIENIVFTNQGFETDPSMVTVAASPESMLVVKLEVDIAGALSQCHIVMPLTMIAPVQAKLEASGQGSLRGRDRFHRTMRQSLQQVHLTLKGNLCEAPVTLRDMLKMAPGDVIPVDLPANIGLNVENIPVLFGRFGKARGVNAVCMAYRAKLPSDVTDNLLPNNETR